MCAATEMPVMLTVCVKVRDGDVARRTGVSCRSLPRGSESNIRRASACGRCTARRRVGRRDFLQAKIAQASPPLTTSCATPVSAEIVSLFHPRTKLLMF